MNLPSPLPEPIVGSFSATSPWKELGRDPGLLDESYWRSISALRHMKSSPFSDLAPLPVLLLRRGAHADDAMAFADPDLRVAIIPSESRGLDRRTCEPTGSDGPADLRRRTQKSLSGTAPRAAFRVAHQRGAVGQRPSIFAPTQRGVNRRIVEFRWRPAWPRLAIVVEAVDMLLELANDEEGAIPAEIARRRQPGSAIMRSGAGRQDAGHGHAKRGRQASAG